MRIILLGGGLGHIQFIRDKAKNMSADVEIILVSPKPHIFYQPAFEDVLTGRRQIQDAIIDLRKISTLAGVTFIQSEIESIDTDRKIIKLVQRASLQYDFLSIEGVEVPQPLSPKPFHQAFYVRDFIEFFRKLDEFERELAEARPNRFYVGVVGGGELGVRVSRHLPERLRKYSPKLCWEIFEKDDVILSHYQAQIRRKVEQELRSRDVLYHTQYLVKDVTNGRLVDANDSKRVYEADIVLIAGASQIPNWMRASNLPMTQSGVLDAHPNLLLKHDPSIIASGEVIGLRPSVQGIETHLDALGRITRRQQVASKRSFDKAKKKDVSVFFDKAYQVRWGFLQESEKLFQESQSAMKASLDHLRAVKEQKKAQLYPQVEENTYVDKLKKRLTLDIPVESMEALFAENLGHSHQINAWFEREYKDVFNDHYLSSFHMGLDLLDQSFLRGGRPEYMRLYISAPSSIKDVEILSQILVGAFKACKNKVSLKIHICGQAMNTVQFSLGARLMAYDRVIPEPVAYIALTRPLGLYSLLSQQGKSIWEGQWLSDIWNPLSTTHQEFSAIDGSSRQQFSVFQLDETGLVNGLVKNLNTDGWRICLNLSALPRWEGVDQILRQNPMDQLLDKNWQRGFRYWSGQGEKFPDSQYLLWEPQLTRSAACLLIDPAMSYQLDKELRTKYQQKLHFIGYAEKTSPGQQTYYKLSDWTFDGQYRETQKAVQLEMKLGATESGGASLGLDGLAGAEAVQPSGVSIANVLVNEDVPVTPIDATTETTTEIRPE